MAERTLSYWIAHVHHPRAEEELASRNAEALALRRGYCGLVGKP